MTHVPCPPVKITPAVFQRCSIIGCAANENNGACGEETRQTKREKKASWTEIPAGLLYTYTSSFPFPSNLEVDPLPTHTHVEIFKKSSQGFSVAIQPGDLPKLSAGTLFCGGGSFGLSPAKMHHCVDPPRVGG